MWNLLGIPPEKQKILVKGGRVDDDWSATKVKKGSAVLVIGDVGARGNGEIDQDAMILEYDMCDVVVRNWSCIHGPPPCESVSQ